MNGAADGDTVQVRPGTYGSATAAIDLTDLDAPDRAVTVQGVMGPARPVIPTGGTLTQLSFTTAALAPPVFDPSLPLSVGRGRAAGQLLLSRRTVTLFVRCGGVRCTALATGTVRAGRRTLGRLTAPRRTLSLAPDTRGRLRLRSSSKLRRTVRRHLLRHRRAKVTIVLRGHVRRRRRHEDRPRHHDRGPPPEALTS